MWAWAYQAARVVAVGVPSPAPLQDPCSDLPSLDVTLSEERAGWDGTLPEPPWDGAGMGSISGEGHVSALHAGPGPKAHLRPQRPGPCQSSPSPLVSVSLYHSLLKHRAECGQ